MSRRLHGSRWLWGALLVAAVGAAAWHTWLSDDVFVTFRCVDQLLSGNGPVYNPGERSEGFTHFLWFVLLAVLHGMHLPLEFLGRALGLPFFAATLALLWLLSRRLFAAPGAATVPIAALAWAAHGDARLFASGGLETACFTFFLVLGFTCLTAAPRRGIRLLGIWALCVASLVRPDGLLYLVLGLAAGLVLERDRATFVRGLLLATLLVVPLFVFRMAYYGVPFPNPYYAKSGNLPYWQQGWHYLSLYVRVYPALLLALPMSVWAVVDLRRAASPASPGAASRNAALVLAAVFAAAHILAVTRVGGDFMFARFLLPATPFLLLLCEALVRRLPGTRLQTLTAAVLVLSFLAGSSLKNLWLGGGRHVWGIVDEPQFYPADRVAQARAEGVFLRPCFEHSGARVLVVAGQLMHAYYARYPVAVELCGLTDPHVAHSPLVRRERPGHEKYATAEYVYARRVHFRQRTRRQARALPPYTILTLPHEGEPLYFEIIVYDDEVLRRVQESCPEARFVPFVDWFETEYVPLLAANSTERLVRDVRQFQRYYVDGHPEAAPLLDPLRDELRRRGVKTIPVVPLDPEQFRDFSPYVQNGHLLPH